MSDDRYARVFYDRIDRDEKFDGIRNDRALMGSWLLLLVQAERAWPSPAFPLPASWVPARDFRVLVERGIVDVLPDHRYRMHGLDNVRAERSKRGADAAAARWAGAERNATGNASASAAEMPSKAKQSKEEQSIPRAREGLPNLSDTVAQLWEQATGRTVLASGQYAADYLDDACRRHPDYQVGAAIVRARKQYEHIPDAASMVSAMRPILDPLPDRKRVAVDEREREERAQSRRRVAATLETIHKNGGHEAEVRPGCPMCEAVTA